MGLANFIIAHICSDLSNLRTQMRLIDRCVDFLREFFFIKVQRMKFAQLSHFLGGTVAEMQLRAQTEQIWAYVSNYEIRSAHKWNLSFAEQKKPIFSSEWVGWNKLKSYIFVQNYSSWFHAQKDVGKTVKKRIPFSEFARLDFPMSNFCLHCALKLFSFLPRNFEKIRRFTQSKKILEFVAEARANFVDFGISKFIVQFFK